MSIGARLRRAREQKGLSLDSLSRVTRVTLPILTAIEQDNVGAIPPRPYGRGFVRTYASEVGLDPDQAVIEYFAQFAPPPPPAPVSPPAPSAPSTAKLFASGLTEWMGRPVVATIASATLAIAVIAAGWGLDRADAPRAVGTAGGSVPSPVGTTGRGTTGSIVRGTTTQSPADKGVTVALEATGLSWVTASVDGRRVIYRTLQPGDREVLRAKQEIRIRTGDAGALRWQIGRGATARMGKPGEVRTARVTLDGAR